MSLLRAALVVLIAFTIATVVPEPAHAQTDTEQPTEAEPAPEAAHAQTETEQPMVAEPGPEAEPEVQSAEGPPAPTAVEIPAPADAAAAAAPAEPAVPDVTLQFRMGRGLVIATSDRQFQLGIRPRVQFLGTVAAQDAGGDPELGLEIRRARLVFEGHFLGPENRFKLELAFSPRDMAMEEIDGSNVPTRSPLLDFYYESRHLRDLSFRIGQYKVPYNRERVISSGNLAMVDRSIANGEFNLDRDVGFDIRSADFLGLGMFRYYAGIYTAEGRDGFRMDDLGLMYLARVEVLPFGMFDDYDEVDFDREERPRLSIGVSYGFVDQAPGNRGIIGSPPRDGGTTDYHNFEADLLFQYAGLTVMTEFFWREGQRNPGDAVDQMGAPIPVELPRNGVGFFAQAGYLLPGIDFEVATRYGRIDPIGGNTQTSLGERSELGLALSYYFDGHPYKLQADYFHLWSGSQFDQGEERVRLQLQASL